MAELIKRRNSTSLDEVGLKHSLVRGHNEELEEFYKRILKCNSNLSYSKYKIERSFEYCTPLQGFEIFKITKVNPEENVVVEITETRVQVTVDSVLVYNQKLLDLKFLKDFKQDLSNVPNINIEVTTSESWEYLKTVNLVQNTSQRTRLYFEAIGNVTELSEKEIENVQDFGGTYLFDVEAEEAIAMQSQYAIEDKNVFHKYSSRREEIFFTYQDFPMYITWSPIRSYKVNREEFNDILKDRIKNAEAFGLIDENTEVDNTETVEVLSQRGAKIINRILEKHNTYWGE